MARLRTTTSKNIKYHSIIEDYYRNEKRTTKTLVTLGNKEEIIRKKYTNVLIPKNKIS